MYKQVFFLLAVASASFSLPLNIKFTTVNEKYHVSEIELEFMQAYALCKINGWSLATEVDAQETTTLNDILTSIGATSSFHWLGGFYQNGGWGYPQWIWLDSGAIIDYSNWLGSVPDSPQDSCFVKTPLSIATLVGKWSLTNCLGHFYFVCKSP